MSLITAQKLATLASTRALGQSVQVRDLATLKRLDKTGDDAAVTSALVVSAASEDDTEVTVAVQSGGQQQLRGRLPEGLPVTVDGQSHTLSADAVLHVPANSITLSLASGLTADVAAGALATWNDYYSPVSDTGSTSIPVVHGHKYTNRDDQGRPASYEIMVPVAATTWVPAKGAQAWDGAAYLGAFKDDMGSDVIAWRMSLQRAERR